MGMRGQHKNKRDANEAAIVLTLRAHGFDVVHTDKPLDLVVGRDGKTYLIEIKNGPKAKLTAFQEAFFGQWRGHAAILTSVQEAEEWAREVRVNDRV